MSKNPPNNGNIVRLAISFEAGIFLFSLILGWLLNAPPLRQLHLNWSGLTLGTIAVGPLLLAMWGCSRSRFGPLRELMRQVNKQIVPLFLGAPSYALLLVSLLAGIGEECLFRGVLQSELTGLIGMPLALVLTSTIFGLAHLITPTYAVLAGLIGCYLGVLLILTDNLLVPVMAHALYDYAALEYLIGSNSRRYKNA